MITVGGLAIPPRSSHDCEFSYNGGATTTILFPRLNLHTGSDATAGTTGHSIVPLPSGRAARLRNLFIGPDSDVTWGVSAIWMQSALGPSPAAYTTIGICHTAAIPSGGALTDVWSAGGVPFTQVFSWDQSTDTYVSETTDMLDIGNGDVALLPATEAALDRTIYGHTAQFTEISLSSLGGTAGIGGTVIWEYYNGTTWVALAGVVDGTAGYTAAVSHGQRVTFTNPGSAWIAATINGQAGCFWISSRVLTTYSTNPLYSHGYVRAPHTIPAGHVVVIGLDTNGAAHGDTRLTARFEAA